MDIDRRVFARYFRRISKVEEWENLGGRRVGRVDLFCSCSRRKVAGSRETKGWSRSERGDIIIAAQRRISLGHPFRS